MKILGAGFSCIDMIKTDKSTRFMNGGTCLNVLTVLAQLGWESKILSPLVKVDTISDIFEDNLERLNVGLLECGKNRRPVSRLIQIDNEKKEHQFILECPKCGRKMIFRPFGNESEYKQTKIDLNTYDLFYFDRISYGIKQILKEFAMTDKPLIYEPNSGRNQKAIIEISSQTDIIKFSVTKISLNVADKIAEINKDTRLKLLIATDGEKGLYFKFRGKDGEFSEWLKIEAAGNQKVVDTSGAGDWLTAGFLYSFFNGKECDYNMESVKKALLFGMQLSEICMCAEGAQGVFYSEELLQFLRDQYHFKLKHCLEMRSPAIVNEKVCEVCYL